MEVSAGRMMLKPRSLPPLHKNQLQVPVRCIGFDADRPTVSNFYRNHAVARKKVRRKPSQIWVPTASRKSSESDAASDVTDVQGRASDIHGKASDTVRASGVFGRASDQGRATGWHGKQSDVRGRCWPTPRVERRKSPMYVRGRATGTDDVKSSVVDVLRSFDDTRPVFGVGRRSSDISDAVDIPHRTSPVDDDSRQNSSVQEHLPVSDDVPDTTFTPRPLACSKYNVIGEPKNRKKRPVRTVWTLPKLPIPKGFITELDPEDDNPKTNKIDVRSIYGKKSKMESLPPREDTVFGFSKLPRQNSVILPPLEIHRQRGEVHFDAERVVEKRVVMDGYYTEPKVLKRIFRDHVAFPTAYKPYFRYRKRRERFAQSVFPEDEFWENNRKPVHCSRCIHQSRATLHYCDVLGKRFCRFCTEMADRGFSQTYEKSRLLVASPFKSPTLNMLREPSFIGVRKVVITRTPKTREGGEGRENSKGPPTT